MGSVFRKRTLKDLLLVCLVLLVGAFYYSYTEHWPFARGLYLAVVTLTTVGYGDVVPQNENARLFTIIYLLFSMTCFARLLSNLVAHEADLETIRKRQTLIGKAISRDEVAKMGDEDGTISAYEWLTLRLVAADIVS